MADGGKLVIKIDGDDSGFKEVTNATKSTVKKAADEASKTSQDAMKSTETAAKKSADKVAAEVEQSAKKAEQATKKAADEIAKKTQTVMSNQADLMGGINKAAIGVATGAAAAGAAVVGMGVKYNAEMEQYKAGFTTMLGSAEKANETISQLKSFAEKTPFELGDLASASTTLLAFGEDINSLMPALKMLGDISLGNKEKFKGLALVFGQVQSQGKLMGQDLLQMINQGFNPLQVISQKTGESMASLKDRMSAGEISFEMVADAMRTATSEGGQFYNAMEAQSKTLTGQLSTLKDNVSSLTGEITADLSDTLAKEVMPMLLDKTEDLKQAWADGTLQEALKLAASGATALGTAVAGMNVALVANDLMQLTRSLEGYTAVTKIGTAAQKAMNAELIANPYTAVAVALAALTAGVVTYAATHKSAADEIRKSHEEAIKAIDDTAASEMAQAETAMYLKNRLYELESQINSGTLADEDATKAKEEFAGVADQLNTIIPGIIDNIYDENGAMAIQKGQVDSLTNSYIALANAKAMAAAYQSKIQKTAEALIDVEEKLKPYEDGSKSKTVDLHGTYGGKTYTTSLPEREFTKLTAEKSRLENEKQSFLTSLADETKKIKDMIGDTVSNVDDNIRKGVKSSTKAVKTGNKAKTASTKSAAQKQTDIFEKQYEKELRDLQFARDMEQITEAEYYKNLAAYRDKYFSEGSKEWQQYTSEIYKYQKGLYEKSINDANKTLDESKKNLQEQIDNIKSLQQSIAGTLKNHNALYVENSITGANAKGTDEIITYTVLADLSKQTEELNRYADNIEAIKRRGVVPQSFIDEIRSLPVSEGLMFTDVLLGTSDEKFNKYIKQYNEKQEAIERISKDATASQTKALTGEVKSEFEKMSEDFIAIGETSAKHFQEGFLNELNGLMETASAEIGASLAAILPSFDGGGRVIDGVTVNGSYNTTSYNITATGGSEQGWIQSVRDFEQMRKMSGGY